MIEVLAIALLVLVNGLFVAAEFAIIAVPRTSIERRAAVGSRLARRVRDILRDPRRQDQYIATAQLGITLASIGLGMYGEHALADWLAGHLNALGVGRWVAAPALASVIAVVALTYVHIVAGEMVPKAIALQHAERTALAVTPPMLWTRSLLYPLVIALNGIGNGVLRLLGVRRTATGAEHTHTQEELELIVRESEEGGLLPREAGKVLRELFDFGELTAGQVMVPRVRIAGIPRGAGPEAVRSIVQQTRHTRYPVFDGDLDHIAGVIDARDILRALAMGQPPVVTAGEPVSCVPETARLDEVLTVLRGERAQMVIVLDEHGGTAGLVTADDLAEEIVGEITHGGESAIVEVGPGRFRVAGTVRLDELGEQMDRRLEHEDVDTVSGLILSLLGRAPRVGDAVVFQGLRLEVESLAGRGVRHALVTRPGSAAERSATASGART